MIKNQKLNPFPYYGWTGLFVILVAEILLMFNIQVVKMFFTPIIWTGYILFVDALLKKVKGRSYLIDRPQEFLFMLPISLVCWLIFEAYNLHLKNWQYINLPQNMLLRMIGYVWSFSTIFPAILLTSELLDGWRLLDRFSVKKFRISKTILFVWIMVGILFLGLPLLVPMFYARYLFGLVWMGFIFLLDPINALVAEHSLFLDLQQGKINKLLSLFLSGTICGLLWEFWNYWAATKWIYTLPFLQKPRIFEMPVVGFVGFLPFAVECYAMWILSRFVFQTMAKLRLKSTSSVS